MNTQIYKFKVKFGFSPLDRVSIGLDELEKALYAQKYGVVVQLGNKQISGKYIISIEPDYHYYTGWYETYTPSNAEDMAQITRDCPKELDGLIKETRVKVDYLVATKQLNLIGKNIDIEKLRSGDYKQIDN
jgi:hypothetical protein